MAIAFARVTVHSRSYGHSAVAGAAYRSGSVLTDERTGETHDFSHRSDVVYQSVMLPDSANPLFNNREYLWNQVEAAEDKSNRRKNAQVAKDIILALPRELSLDDQITLARNFAYDHFVKNGLVVDVAIHDHSDGNPHAHLYVTTRRLVVDSFDRYKARDLNPSFANWEGGSGFINEEDKIAEGWRDFQNTFFADHNLDFIVDENHLITQRHEGRVRGEKRSYLKEENQLRREASIEIALESPEAVLNELGRKYTVFTDRHIEQILSKNTETADQKAKASARLREHSSFIYLGLGEDGRARYTTQTNYQREAYMAEQAENLFLAGRAAITLRHVNHAIVQYGLNSEQADALHHLSDGKQIAAIVGRAGTGKSYMMRAANEMWEASGFNVLGMGVSGVAAKGLEKGSGITSHTIAYYRQLLQNDAWQLNRDSIVVMDEAGMTDLHDMAMVVRHVARAGAKLVLVGDHAQLQPIGIGAPFRALIERIGFSEINRVMRQQDPADAATTALLSKGEIAEAISHYQNKGQVFLIKGESETQTALIQNWLERLATTTLDQQIILSYRNVDVANLNLSAREALMKLGKISSTQSQVTTANGVISLSTGERILFLRNNKSMGVNNGDFATVLAIDDEKITVRLKNSDNNMSFSTKDYEHFTYGYAATVHKSQGTTFDNVFVYASTRLWDRFLTYVALSRHKNYVALYADSQQFANIDKLKSQLARETIKDNVIDFPLSFAARRGYSPDTLIGRFVEKVSTLKKAIRDSWLFVANYEAYLQLNQHKEKLDHSDTRRNEARIVAEFADLHRSLGKEWSLITRALKSRHFEREDLYKEKGYRELIEKTHYKNSLASEIVADIPRYKRALDLNSLSLESVKKSAHAYEKKKLKTSVLSEKVPFITPEKSDQKKSIETALKKMATIDNEIQNLKKRPIVDAIASYENLMREQYHATEKSKQTALNKKLDKKAVDLFKNKTLFEAIKKMNLTLSQLIQNRAKKVIAKDLDRDERSR